VYAHAARDLKEFLTPVRVDGNVLHMHGEMPDVSVLRKDGRDGLLDRLRDRLVLISHNIVCCTRAYQFDVQSSCVSSPTNQVSPEGQN
jgi:hypothetical protein